MRMFTDPLECFIALLTMFENTDRIRFEALAEQWSLPESYSHLSAYRVLVFLLDLS